LGAWWAYWHFRGNQLASLGNSCSRVSKNTNLEQRSKLKFFLKSFLTEIAPISDKIGIWNWPNLGIDLQILGCQFAKNNFTLFWTGINSWTSWQKWYSHQTFVTFDDWTVHPKGCSIIKKFLTAKLVSYLQIIQTAIFLSERWWLSRHITLPEDLFLKIYWLNKLSNYLKQISFGLCKTCTI